MNENEWVRCPICGNKTRDRIGVDTILVDYPLYCPKCKQETLISVRQLKTTVIKEPDAQTQGGCCTRIEASATALFLAFPAQSCSCFIRFILHC